MSDAIQAWESRREGYRDGLKKAIETIELAEIISEGKATTKYIKKKLAHLLLNEEKGFQQRMFANWDELLVPRRRLP